ncbi:MAG: helix-turn-helix domain-containing protein [Parvularculaceae bacterium]
MTKAALPSDSIEEALGAALQQLRRSRGLTQTELGRRLGVSLQQIQKYESGANRMAASTIFQAAEILGVDVSALFASLRAPHPTHQTRRSYRALVIPPASGSHSAPAREAEIIDVIGRYQAIESAALRAAVRKILKRISSDPLKATGRSAKGCPRGKDGPDVD